MKRGLLALALIASCGKNETPPPRAPSTAPPPTEQATGTCPANGAWAQCSVLYRLERAGLAPTLDSTAKPEDAKLGGQQLVIKIGRSAVLEVHLYADSSARAAASASLDKTQFMNGTQPQTIKRERTLIESANLVGVLTSINAHQRERVSDALTAGPPQAANAAQPMPPAKSTPP